MTDCVAVFVTCASGREALKLKDILLKEKTAACVNIIKGILSFFRWKGRIDSCREVMLVAKTRRCMFGKLARLVRKNHSYEVPEIIALPVVDGSRDYLKWVRENVKK